MKLRLQTSNIRKSYNGNEVLRDCSFSFERPGTYILTGPNGCGKSTFLRICALLEKPDRGDVIYRDKGEIIPGDIALKRRITLVLPRIGLFNTTVFSNIAFGLRIRKLERKEIRERVERALEFVCLTHKRDQNALTLSSGEAQRTGIARALVLRPEILFLDEPTASVDEKNREIIEEIILNLKRSGKSIILMTTHDRIQAAMLADSLMLMKDGKISVS